MNEDLVLIKRLDHLRDKHREIDSMIEVSSMDEFSRMRLKKEKLSVRDQILQLEKLVYPDVIA